MKEIQYKTFSWQTHKKNWKFKKPNVCQFELTFECGLRCKHCYTDCYNSPAYIKKELNTRKIKIILDKVFDAGVIWLCLTGGDPLTRKDFLDIYSYAKDKGFIITIFTNAYSMTKEIADYLQKRPPFVIEMTLNGVTKETYEKVSQIKGSFDKAMEGVKLILNAKIPLKIKTQVTKDNIKEISLIKNFIEDLGITFRPNYTLYARLNGDLAPCDLRLSPEEILGSMGVKKESIDDCQLSQNTNNTGSGVNLFNCAIGGNDGINIDPYGNAFPCALIRKPVFNLLDTDILYAADKITALIKEKKFTKDSKCKACDLRESCLWCPGRALVETKDMETPIPYYCELASTMKGYNA
jgi:radical SAM protein with 4Fe4S-binding SPASM domain